MASSSNNPFNEENDESLDDAFDDLFDQKFDTAFYSLLERQVDQKKKKKRAYIERHHEQGHHQLWEDYFSENPTYPSNLFRRRFRMNKTLFMHIVERLSNEVPFFQQRRDAAGRLSLSGLQKCTAAIRMLAYGTAADAVDEYLRLGESTAISCLEHFTQGIISLFGDEYLRRPTRQDLQRLLREGEERGFPGMIGSIDCMHWEWKNCPTAWKTDGIYPKWATFIQSISGPQSEKDTLFATCQESTRKDVERAFGVLQARVAIVKNPALIWDKAKIGKIMRACIILHNMIVEDERPVNSQYNFSEFQQGEGSRTSEVDMTWFDENSFTGPIPDFSRSPNLEIM
ncbi:uncharacterized protein LOC112081532 [Eutrema salsugineum]|uniref:uncharacterized protein LOC112081532 n=1 Tax=Eutrema salsugineum TaxID=72664 RepID=UPI000CECEBFE|nr:uncharacterized protein LOC112081532 [Eutrema salsugineum]